MGAVAALVLAGCAAVSQGGSGAAEQPGGDGTVNDSWPSLPDDNYYSQALAELESGTASAASTPPAPVHTAVDCPAEPAALMAALRADPAVLDALGSVHGLTGVQCSDGYAVAQADGTSGGTPAYVVFQHTGRSSWTVQDEGSTQVCTEVPYPIAATIPDCGL